MADTLTPYEIVVRRSRYNGLHLDDLDAAGIVAADQGVTVIPVYAEEEEGNHPGEAIPFLSAEVYVWEGSAVVRWSSAELTWADKRDTIVMRQVLARAQKIADLANDLANGVPIPMENPLDRVVDEVAADMQRSWGLAYCTDANAPVLEDRIAHQLAFHAMARLCLIRDRDGQNPLP
jgi:hypothetical protein